MNELVVSQSSIPASIEDLSRFVLIGRDKLQAVKAEISAIQKLGLAKEVYEQKKGEAQEIAEAVTLAEMRTGELLRAVPRADNGGANQYRAKSTPVSNKQKPKSETIKDLGFTQKQAERMQQLADHPDIVKEAIEEARSNDDIVSRAFVLDKIKQAKREEKAKERAERKAYTLNEEFPADMCSLFQGDIQDGLPNVADESVDSIITDPPYPKEFISLYGDLSYVAKRVLKPGGSLLVMCGQSYLPEVMEQLSANMAYHWTLAYMTPGGQSPQLFHKKVNTFWKPVLWYVKGKYEGDWIGDVLKSPTNDNDKRFHEWGQSLGGIGDIVNRFTNPGDTILDPFLGGGTTAVATVCMGRKFIGVDIDEGNVKVSEQRMREAYVYAGREEGKDWLAG